VGFEGRAGAEAGFAVALDAHAWSCLRLGVWTRRFVERSRFGHARARDGQSKDAEACQIPRSAG
jgi:hypothetical protein